MSNHCLLHVSGWDIAIVNGFMTIHRVLLAVAVGHPKLKDELARCAHASFRVWTLGHWVSTDLWVHYRQQTRGDEVERYNELRLQANVQTKLDDGSQSLSMCPKPYYGFGCEIWTSFFDNVKETYQHEMHEALEQAYVKHVGEIVYVHVKKQKPIRLVVIISHC